MTVISSGRLVLVDQDAIKFHDLLTYLLTVVWQTSCYSLQLQEHADGQVEWPLISDCTNMIANC